MADRNGIVRQKPGQDQGYGKEELTRIGATYSDDMTITTSITATPPGN